MEGHESNCMGMFTERILLSMIRWCYTARLELPVSMAHELTAWLLDNREMELSTQLSERLQAPGWSTPSPAPSSLSVAGFSEEGR